jgi:acetyl esterase/lipase
MEPVGCNSTMADILWRGMTRPELDAAYNNAAAVENSAEKIAEYAERSARMRARRNELLDLRYGPKPRNLIDIYHSDAANAPLFAFVHGGYWLRNSKETFACAAEGPLAHGIDVAMIGYTLAPEATLSEIDGEIRTALRFLRAEGNRLGIAQNGIVLSGWSAGGHLAAMTLSEADAGLSISGLYDVEPCRLNYVNDTLHMTAEEARAMSPILSLETQTRPMTIAYGLAERPEFQRQSRDYHAARMAAGLPSELLALEGHDHFSILEELADPAGKLARAAVALAARLRSR